MVAWGKKDTKENEELTRLLQKSIDELQGQLKEAQERVKYLEASKTQPDKKIQVEVEKLKKELEHRSANITKLENEKLALEKSVKTLQQSNINLDKKEQEIKKRFADIEAKELKLLEQEEQHTNALAKLNADKRGCEQDLFNLKALKKQIEFEQKKILAKEKSLADQEKRLIDLQGTLNDKKESLDSRELKMDNILAEKRLKVEEELSKKRRDVEIAASEIKQAAAEEANDLKIKAQQAAVTIRTKAEQDLLTWKEAEIKKVTDSYNDLRKAFDKDIADKKSVLFNAMMKSVDTEKQQRLNELEKEVKAKRAELAEEQKSIEELKKSAQAALADYQQKCSEYQAKLEDQKWETDRLAEKKRALDARGVKLDEELEVKFKSVIDSYQKEKDVLADELERVTDSYNVVLKELESFESFSAMFDDKPEIIKKRLKDLEETKKALEQKLADRPAPGTKEEIQRLKDENDALVSQNDTLNKKVANLMAEHRNYVNLESERDALKAELDDTKLKVSTYENRIEALKNEIKRLSTTEEVLKERDQRIAAIREGFNQKYKNPENEEGQPTSEIAWLNEISKNCHEYGIDFPKRILYAFHTALKIADWSTVTVLAGVSGTGKSELPRMYSLMGRIAFQSVSVQPNWDSQESMLGYFNSIDNRFVPEPVLSFLLQANEELKNTVGIVLLDEMNLAHIEYYFAEFLSKLELRRGLKKDEEPTINVKLGAGVKDLELKLSRNILWCGTMNQDETTKSLSDKVLDRGLVINFPRPKSLIGREEMKILGNFNDEKMKNRPMLSYNTWRSWVATKITKDSKKTNIAGFKGEQLVYLNGLKDIVEKINDNLGFVGRALGHRVWQSIEYYIANYPEVIAEKAAAKEGEATTALKNAMHIAFEDELVQKVMPKLRGIDTRGKAKEKCLDPIKQILINGDFNLEADFNMACELGYGQFMWCSAEYINDKEIAGVSNVSKDDK